MKNKYSLICILLLVSLCSISQTITTPTSSASYSVSLVPSNTITLVMGQGGFQKLHSYITPTSTVVLKSAEWVFGMGSPYTPPDSTFTLYRSSFGGTGAISTLVPNFHLSKINVANWSMYDNTTPTYITNNITLYDGIGTSTISTSLAMSNTIVISKGSLVATDTAKLGGYYLGSTGVPKNIRLFDAANTNVNIAGVLSIYRSATTSTIVLNASNLTMLLLTVNDPNVSGNTWWRLINGGTTITDTKSLSNEIDLKLYPNPAINELHVSLNENTPKAITLSLFNSTGELVRKESYYESVDPKKINIEKLSSGIYFLHISVDAKSTIQKIVKE